MKAIETHFQGYRFRSRLEARYAIFLNALGIPWLYEHEGFDINGVWYLPDFYLPGFGCYAEVKPCIFTRQQFDLAMALKGGCLLFDGAPDVKLYNVGYSCEFPNAQHDAYACYKAGHEYGRVNLPYSVHKGRLWLNWGEGIDDIEDLDALRYAVTAARGARFEYGEKGISRF